MKKHPLEFDLKAAFPPMPEDCKAALMCAARSVKEEKPMKRTVFRTGLVIALTLLLTMTAAFAASQLGLIDLLKDYADIALPESAQKILAETQRKSYDVGPLTVTLQETLADGHILYADALAQAKKPAVLTSDPTLHMDSNHAKALGVDEKLTYQEAAQAAKLPLYEVMFWLETDWDWREGEEMMEQIYNEQGEMLLIDMISTNPSLVPDTIEGALSVVVYELDPATGERVEGKVWRLEDPIEIPVQGAIATKEYQIEKEMSTAGFTLQSAQAEQTCVGVYFTSTWQADAPHDLEKLHEFYISLAIRDEKGNSIPDGANFSGVLNDENWPTVVYGNMLGIDYLPETLMIQNVKTDEQILLK